MRRINQQVLDDWTKTQKAITFLNAPERIKINDVEFYLFGDIAVKNKETSMYYYSVEKASNGYTCIVHIVIEEVKDNGITSFKFKHGYFGTKIEPIYL